MALKLALVIDGDAGGAKKAVEETGQAIDELAGKASKAGEALKDVKIEDKGSGNPWGDLGAAGRRRARQGRRRARQGQQ
jgi:hypothetical protein